MSAGSSSVYLSTVFGCPIDVYILRLLYWAVAAYRSMNAIVAQSKNCPFGVNTTTKLKNVTTTSNNYGIWRAMFWLNCAGIVAGSGYTFQLNRTTNSKSQFLGCATISWAMCVYFDLSTWSMEKNTVLNPSIYAYLVTTEFGKKSWTLGCHVTFKPIQSYITHLLVHHLLMITIYTSTVLSVPLCGCATSSPIMSDDHRLRVYEERYLGLRRTR